MQELSTIARPYAKAIFKLGVVQNSLSSWSVILSNLSIIMNHSTIIGFVGDPTVSEEQKVKVLLDILNAGSDEKIKNLLLLLVKNKRLLLLPTIAKQFEFLKAQQEQSVQTTVISATELSASQLQKIKERIEKRLQQAVKLDTRIDKKIIGGVIIKAGDLVIDASVRGKLNQLAEQLN